MKKTIKKLGACDEGLDWLGDKLLEAAWAECHRGDWMLWLSSRVGVDIKTMTLAKVRCARLVQHLMKDQRSLDALVVAEAFAGGTATRSQLDAANNAANNAANAAANDADAAYYAADDADDAAYYAAALYYAASAASAASAADAAAASDAAAALYYAAADADDASAVADAAVAARKKTQHQCAKICRDTIPLHDVLRLIKEQGE